ncbi:hypothetical protein CTO_0417 [Chlamydia trachomatis A2497]|uniref:Uncharacterized protein n=1 Tax=Chlamydia trachomatis serovar A (strain A2497) TaxID=580047 RepID=G4NMX0_CHLT4|nr:hypothetical protein [Chlamydia trachomatis]AEP35234.1 hypothetical protein CTO_0417 [Chlamydia trachomatis A2497]CAX09048.1 conserved hypothetical protein [Chlamydia trachomatis A2497]CCP48670.1 hypothetical protein A5291_00409 [Chlamydia trachomatis A/5291]
MLKQKFRLFFIQGVMCLTCSLLCYCRKLLKGRAEYADEALFQAFLTTLIDVISDIKQLPNGSE